MKGCPSLSFSLVTFEINYFIDLPLNFRRSLAESVALDPSLMFVPFILFLIFLPHGARKGAVVRFRHRSLTLSPATGLHYSSPKVSPNSISASIRRPMSLDSHRGLVKSKKPGLIESIVRGMSLDACASLHSYFPWIEDELRRTMCV